jgi:hypothetical protein
MVIFSKPLYPSFIWLWDTLIQPERASIAYKSPLPRRPTGGGFFVPSRFPLPAFSFRTGSAASLDGLQFPPEPVGGRNSDAGGFFD